MEHIVNQNLMVSSFKGFTTPAAYVLLWEKLQDIAQGKYRKAVSNLGLLIAQDKPEEELLRCCDFSPDLDGDGAVKPGEWTKACPCFEVKAEFGVG